MLLYEYIITKINYHTKFTILLLTVLMPINAVSIDKIESNYVYIEDTERFSAHQYQHNLQTSLIDFTHIYEDATDVNTTYSYNQATITTSFKGKNWSIVAGPGIISSSTRQFNPSYSFIGKFELDNHSNIELIADRSPVISANPQQFANISDYISDNITLNSEYQIIKDLNIAVGALTQQISDGNARYGGVSTVSYTINDTVSLAVKSKYIWSDEGSDEYFSPELYEHHRFLANYTTPIWNENIILKVSAGPSIVNINSRRELVPYYDIKILYDVNKVGKFTIGYNCLESTFEYKLCQVTGNFQINFLTTQL